MRLAGWSIGLLLILAVRSAGAQAVGDSVRLETESGIVEGTLLDKLPDGYLIRSGEKTEVVPYAKVKSIAPVPKSAQETPPAPTTEPAPPPQPPPEQPPAAQPEPAKTEMVAAAPSARPVKSGRRSPGLVAGGVTSVVFGGIGLTVGAVLLPIGLIVASGNECHDPNKTMTFDCEYGNASDMVTAGAITLGVSAALLVGGIVMIVVGSSPTKQQQGRLAPPARGALWTF